jgi:hypothetical protein
MPRRRKCIIIIKAHPKPRALLSYINEKEHLQLLRFLPWHVREFLFCYNERRKIIVELLTALLRDDIIFRRQIVNTRPILSVAAATAVKVPCANCFL